MTELQWLIKMLTQQKLSPTLKDQFIERIGEVEASLSRSEVKRQTIPMNIQAPSMQRILDEAPPVPVIPPTQRIVGGEVNTGNGTKGPRKF